MFVTNPYLVAIGIFILMYVTMSTFGKAMNRKTAPFGVLKAVADKTNARTVKTTANPP